MKKYLKLFTFIPALFMMFIIWGFSNSTADESSSLSLEVTNQIVEIVDTINFKRDMSLDNKNIWIERLHTPVRKCAHMAEYAILSMTLIFPFYLYKFRKCKLNYTVLIICLVYSASDEFHQVFITERAGRVTDVMIDMIGCILTLMIFTIISDIIIKKRLKHKDNNVIMKLDA